MDGEWHPGFTKKLDVMLMQPNLATNERRIIRIKRIFSRPLFPTNYSNSLALSHSSNLPAILRLRLPIRVISEIRR